MNIQNPFTIASDPDSLSALEGLKRGRTYRDILTQPDGTVQVGKLSFEVKDLGDVLDVAFEPPKAVDGLLSVRERLEKLQASNEKRIAALNKSVETKARRLIMKSTTTKGELVFQELRDKVAQLDLFNNPIGKAPDVKKTRTADKNGNEVNVFQVRIYGSALTNILPGEDAQTARDRLGDMMINDKKVLVSIMGLKPGPASELAVQQLFFNYRGELPEGQAGVLIGYTVTFTDVGKLSKCVDRLLEVSNTIHVLDASRADSATLRLNLSTEDLLAEAEGQEDSDDLDLADAI